MENRWYFYAQKWIFMQNKRRKCINIQNSGCKQNQGFYFLFSKISRVLFIIFVNNSQNRGCFVKGPLWGCQRALMSSSKSLFEDVKWALSNRKLGPFKMALKKSRKMHKYAKRSGWVFSHFLERKRRIKENKLRTLQDEYQDVRIRKIEIKMWEKEIWDMQLLAREL